MVFDETKQFFIKLSGFEFLNSVLINNLEIDSSFL
jgi:hypothetical protein